MYNICKANLFQQETFTATNFMVVSMRFGSEHLVAVQHLRFQDKFVFITGPKVREIDDLAEYSMAKMTLHITVSK